MPELSRALVNCISELSVSELLRMEMFMYQQNVKNNAVHTFLLTTIKNKKTRVLLPRCDRFLSGN